MIDGRVEKGSPGGRGPITLVGLVLPAVAWYAVDYLAVVTNWLYFAVRASGRWPARVNYAGLVGDPQAWYPFFGRWVSLSLPVVVLIAFALAGVRLTWRTGLATGLIIAAAHWIAGVIGAWTIRHTFDPAGGFVVLSLLYKVIPGPLAAAAASRIRVADDEVA